MFFVGDFLFEEGVPIVAGVVGKTQVSGHPGSPAGIATAAN